MWLSGSGLKNAKFCKEYEIWPKRKIEINIGIICSGLKELSRQSKNLSGHLQFRPKRLYSGNFILPGAFLLWPNNSFNPLQIYSSHDLQQHKYIIVRIYNQICNRDCRELDKIFKLKSEFFLIKCAKRFVTDFWLL